MVLPAVGPELPASPEGPGNLPPEIQARYLLLSPESKAICDRELSLEDKMAAVVFYRQDPDEFALSPSTVKK